MSSSLLFLLFFQVSIQIVQERKFCFIELFCPLKSKVDSFFHIQFSRLLLDILLCYKEII